MTFLTNLVIQSLSNMRPVYKLLSICMIIATAAVLLWMAAVKIQSSRTIVQDHTNYSELFNDVQKRQIVAAQKYGITPLKDRTAADEAIKSGNLVKLTNCKSYKLAPMGYSIPYLTENANMVLEKIGTNFRDSLSSKGLCDNKIIVTSVLRTDADVERLMKYNSVAVKNSAHRYATTFDISYTRFAPAGLNLKTTKGDLKKVLGEVLRDLRNEKLCYVKYEKSQGCFHITVRQ